MEFIESYFGETLSDLTYQDIVKFFVDEKEETDNIEFKAFSTTYGNLNKNLEGVIRGICAFLNSNGGVLIWGAPEGQSVTGKKEKVFKGSLSPVNELKEKDWLISKISDSITPLPVDIKVAILESSGSYVYVFEIQQSNYKPHQFKHTYFARLDGQTKPAPHYLVEALFRQIKYPNLEGYIKLGKISHDGSNIYLDIEILIFNFSPLQNAEKAFFRLMSPNGKFTRASNPAFADMYGYEGQFLHFKNRIDILHYGAPNVHNERIIFSPYDKEIQLILMFGSKETPLKTSKYKLDLSLKDWSKAENPNYLFTEIVENKLNVEGINELGITKEESLKKMLGRDVNAL